MPSASLRRLDQVARQLDLATREAAALPDARARQAARRRMERLSRLYRELSRNPVPTKTNPTPLYLLHAEAAFRKASAQFARAGDADAKYRTAQTGARRSATYRRMLEAQRRVEAAEARALAERLAARQRNPRKKKRLIGGEWQPDLFGGRGIQRAGVFAPGLTRAEQLELARQEMRETGSRDLFDALEDRRSNPDRSGKPDIPKVQNGVHLLRGSDGFGTYCEVCNRPVGPIRATLQAALADRIKHVHRNPPADTPQNRYQRAVGHGEHRRTAEIARNNPGQARGRMAPNCPMCGALVRLHNPIPPVVRCAGCGAESRVRRP